MPEGYSLAKERMGYEKLPADSLPLPPSVSLIDWEGHFHFSISHDIKQPWQVAGSTHNGSFRPVTEKEEGASLTLLKIARFASIRKRRGAVLQVKRSSMASAAQNSMFCPSNIHEAYRIYKQMKANHWEPDVIDMTKDCALWNSNKLCPRERWIIEMGVGYFSAAEGIVGDSVFHVIEDNLTAAELKHASLRQIAEESIHMDSLLHIIGSLNIDLDEVTAKFQDIPSIQKKNAFITRQMPELKMEIDLTITENKQKFAKAIFGITQVMEGTQFYALFAMILSLHRQNKMTGIGQMFQYTLRDESNHIALGRYILEKLIEENPDIWTEGFRKELVEFMREGVELEKEFVLDCLPEDMVGMTQKDFLRVCRL